LCWAGERRTAFLLHVHFALLVLSGHFGVGFGVQVGIGSVGLSFNWEVLSVLLQVFNWRVECMKEVIERSGVLILALYSFAHRRYL
jgi:hypothetical protein